MRVIAIKDGHYDRYIPAFTIFEVDPKRVMQPGPKLDGKGRPVMKEIVTLYGLERVQERDPENMVLASWLMPDTPANRKIVEDLRRNGPTNATAAAIKAAGPKRSKRGFAVAKGAEEAASFEDMSRRSRSNDDDLV